jgi:fructose-1,6-bisphosphatase
MLVDSRHSLVLIFSIRSRLNKQSNMDCNFSVGTIFAIYRRDAKNGDNDAAATAKELLRKGTDIVASGYCLYGSATIMVLTTGQGVDEFTVGTALLSFCLCVLETLFRVTHAYTLTHTYYNAFQTARFIMWRVHSHQREPSLPVARQDLLHQ